MTAEIQRLVPTFIGTFVAEEVTLVPSTRAGLMIREFKKTQGDTPLPAFETLPREEEFIHSTIIPSSSSSSSSRLRGPRSPPGQRRRGVGKAPSRSSLREVTAKVVQLQADNAQLTKRLTGMERYTIMLKAHMAKMVQVEVQRALGNHIGDYHQSTTSSTRSSSQDSSSTFGSIDLVSIRSPMNPPSLYSPTSSLSSFDTADELIDDEWDEVDEDGSPVLSADAASMFGDLTE